MILSRWSFAGEISDGTSIRNYGYFPFGQLFGNIVYRADSLSDFKNLPSELRRVDAVIGNPPYQFLSGRGSPVAALNREGNEIESQILAGDIETLIARFPESSKGCRDKYKWFIDRATECLNIGGKLGYIVPNTWMAYPRYRDLRALLVDRGSIDQIVDFGTNAFSSAMVPTAALI